MTQRTTGFSSAIYTDLPLDKIYMPEQLLSHNSWFEPSLNDLQVGDDVEVWSADGSAYKGILTATEDEVQQFRKLLAGVITRRIYAQDYTLLHELSDNELDAMLIFRGINC